MRILGIDPGYATTGFGILEAGRGSVQLLNYGTITTPTTLTFPERLVVLYDDININPGRLRVKRAGSDGGHNGIKNIIYHLQSDRFPRVKIGVGTPEGEDMKDYVLDSISSDTYQGVKAAPDAALAIVLRGVDVAMQEFNGKDFSQE